MRGNLDRVEDSELGVGALEPVVGVAAGRYVVVSGWAFSQGGAKVADQVVVTLESAVVASATVTERPDVAEHFGAASRRAGFRAAFAAPTRPGEHEVAVFAVDGETRNLIGTRTLVVIDPAVAERSPLVYIDEFANQPTRDSWTFEYEEVCKFQGWGVDPTTNGQLRVAAILVDKSLVLACRCGTLRADVQSALDGDSAMLGFECDVFAGLIGSGSHVARALGLQPNGTLLVSDSALRFEVMPRRRSTKQ